MFQCKFFGDIHFWMNHVLVPYCSYCVSSFFEYCVRDLWSGSYAVKRSHCWSWFWKLAGTVHRGLYKLVFCKTETDCMNRIHKEHNIHDRTLCIPVCTMIPPAVWMLLWLFVESGQTYTIPEPSVVVQTPRGFQVSIPGNLFVFNIKWILCFYHGFGAATQIAPAQLHLIPLRSTAPHEVRSAGVHSYKLVYRR